MDLTVCIVHHVAQPFPAFPSAMETVRRVFSRVQIELDYAPYKGRGWVERVACARSSLLRRVTTPFWMSLDDDVEVEPDAVVAALERLTNEPRLGGVGIEYIDPVKGGAPFGTVHLGCAVWRTEATDGLVFRCDGEAGRACECFYFNEDVKARGGTIDYLKGFTARHRDEEG